MQNLKSTKLFFFFCIVLTALSVVPYAIADENTKSKSDSIVQQSDKGNKNDISDHIVRITILQLNDVYEMTPINGQGGLAKIATLKKQLLAKNPNTYMVLSGDLISPSALGTAKVNGEKLAGKQMIDIMNGAGLDFMTFGNHEFDVKKEALLQRLEESKFTWFSANVSQSDGSTFPNVARTFILTVKDADGDVASIGWLAVTLPSNPASYVKYEDVFEASRQVLPDLKKRSDIIIGLTHLSVETDKQVAKQFPQIDLILGGHEHEHMQIISGKNLPVIYKADANVKTVYIHELAYHTDTKQLEINSKLQPIDNSIQEDLAVAEKIKYWQNIAFDGFRKDGFQPDKLVAVSTIPLDGREESVRNKPTALTKILANAMIHVVPDSSLAIYNGGSIRIDDVMAPGSITEYDVIRILPFGGQVMSAKIKGSLLKKVLDQGEANKGNGGYLQKAGVSKNKKGKWVINGKALDLQGTYTIAINDFLISGKEQGLEFLNKDNPDLQVLGSYGDIRQALITELKKEFASK